MMKDIQYFLNTKKKNHMDISTIVVGEKKTHPNLIYQKSYSERAQISPLVPSNKSYNFFF